MKSTVAILAMTLASPAIADTIYITPNLPGGSVQDATRPGYAVQELGGTLTIYRTMPGSANLRDATAPSYTIRRNDFDMSDPGGLNPMKRDMGLDPDDDFDMSDPGGLNPMKRDMGLDPDD